MEYVTRHTHERGPIKIRYTWINLIEERINSSWVWSEKDIVWECIQTANRSECYKIGKELTVEYKTQNGWGDGET